MKSATQGTIIRVNVAGIKNVFIMLIDISGQIIIFIPAGY
jgi:hypothetical protein